MKPLDYCLLVISFLGALYFIIGIMSIPSEVFEIAIGKSGVRKQLLTRVFFFIAPILIVIWRVYG